MEFYSTLFFVFVGYSQKLPLNKETSFSGVDEMNCTQTQVGPNSGTDQKNELYSPWDQTPQLPQISMHSKSNSFYDDGPPNSVSS